MYGREVRVEALQGLHIVEEVVRVANIYQHHLEWLGVVLCQQCDERGVKVVRVLGEEGNNNRNGRLLFSKLTYAHQAERGYAPIDVEKKYQ